MQGFSKKMLKIVLCTSAWGCPDGQCCKFGPSPKGTLRNYVRVLQTIRMVEQ